MDGAWALYEAWLRLQEGDIEIAVVTGSGRSSTGDPSLIYPMEMDPYFLAPLGADPLDLRRPAGPGGDRSRHRRRAHRWPRWPCGPGAKETSIPSWPRSTSANPCGATTCHPSPTGRPPWCWPPGTAPAGWSTGRPTSPASTTAPSATIPRSGPSTTPRPPGWRPKRPAWATARSRSPSCRRHSPTRSCCWRVSSASVTTCRSTPRAVPLRDNPIMATGLCRIGHAADHVMGGGHRALAHSTSGPCLQQNLVCIVEDTP